MPETVPSACKVLLVERSFPSLQPELFVSLPYSAACEMSPWLELGLAAYFQTYGEDICILIPDIKCFLKLPTKVGARKEGIRVRVELGDAKRCGHAGSELCISLKYGCSCASNCGLYEANIEELHL